MDTKALALIQTLADGRWHSGQALAQALGLSRAAVWKRLGALEDLLGLKVESRRGKGYRLVHALELLNESAIAAELAESESRALERLYLLPLIDSTNDYLRERLPRQVGSGVACLAEHQTAGRGRRGRPWVSTFGKNLYLSLAWRFDLPLAQLSGLSLAVGVAVAQGLEALGLRGHGLKWPNDLLLEGRKLGGILVEAGGETAGPCHAIIGLGVNLELDTVAGRAIDQPWTDLRRHLDPWPGRNRLAGNLLSRLIAACQAYQQAGLEPVLEAWRPWDLLLGRPVTLTLGERRIQGRHLGLDASGGLRLETSQGIQVWHAGEVSLRAREA